jgi:ABC-type oligopeptide transport system ATPase subunit
MTPETISTPAPLLRVQHLLHTFSLPQSWWDRLRGKEEMRIVAVNDVNFTITPRSTMALVGESGCGKSTTGRCILRLIEPEAGEIFFQGEDVRAASAAKLRELRRQMQIVFQDPYSSLNPHFTVEQTLTEVLEFHQIGSNKIERKERLLALLHQVGW